MPRSFVRLGDLSLRNAGYLAAEFGVAVRVQGILARRLSAPVLLQVMSPL
jgi:hypothetical protein